MSKHWSSLDNNNNNNHGEIFYLNADIIACVKSFLVRIIVLCKVIGEAGCDDKQLKVSGDLMCRLHLTQMTLRLRKTCTSFLLHYCE
jgi:hypothetical protein